MKREATGSDLKQLVEKLIPEVIGKEIEKSCQSIYPLHNVLIRKVCYILLGFDFEYYRIRLCKPNTNFTIG